MKVLNLQCVDGHAFEGWFGSEDDFQSQSHGGLLECPMCASKEIHKLPSAPRLNLGAAPALLAPVPDSREATAPRQDVAQMPPGLDPQMQAAYLRLVRHVMKQTDDVGERFAEEARRIHHGEAPERGIRGKASREETQALLEEGIEVLPMLIPKGFDGELQ